MKYAHHELHKGTKASKQSGKLEHFNVQPNVDKGWEAVGILPFRCDPPLIVVDLDVKGIDDGVKEWGDWLAAEALDSDEVLETRMVQTPSGGRHIYYTIPAGFDGLHGIGVLPGVDLICTTNLAVPPTEGYEFIDARDPIEMPLGMYEALAALLKQDRRSAKKSAIEDTGTRNVDLLKQACALKRQGFSGGALLDLLRVVNKRFRKGSLPDAELRKIARQAEKLEKGAISEWAERFVYVADQNRFVDCDALPAVVARTPADVTALLAQESKQAGAELLRSPSRVTVPTLTYEPNEPRLLPSGLNLYCAGEVKPAEGPLALWHMHWRKVFAEKDWKHCEQFIASLVQQPHVRIEHALLLIGGSGIGKSMIRNALEAMLGEWNVGNPLASDFEHRYTEWLANRVLVFCDEMEALPHRGQTTLKELIGTRGRVTIDQKYGMRYAMQNRASFVFASNSLNAVRIRADDRRFYVAQAVGKVKQTEIEPVWELVKSAEGQAALLHYYANEVQVEAGFEFKAPATSEGKEAVIEQSVDALVQELEEMELGNAVRSGDVLNDVRVRERSLKAKPTDVRNALREVGFLPYKQPVRIGSKQVRVWVRAEYADATATQVAAMLEQDRNWEH